MIEREREIDGGSEREREREIDGGSEREMKSGVGEKSRCETFTVKGRSQEEVNLLEKEQARERKRVCERERKRVCERERERGENCVGTLILWTFEETHFLALFLSLFLSLSLFSENHQKVAKEEKGLT